MRTTNAYQLYLLSDRLTKELADVNTAVSLVTFRRDHAQRGETGRLVSVTTDYSDLSGHWRSDSENEHAARLFRRMHMGARIDREQPYTDTPGLVVKGVSYLGIAWEVDFHRGECERVIVGTRKVKVPADGAPMVEVDEPVYEWRCPGSPKLVV